MNTLEMLTVIRRHTLQAVFRLMRVVVTYSEGQKQLKEIALHLKSTLTRPPIYDWAYPEKLSTASPRNPASIMKPSSVWLFVKSNRKNSEVGKCWNQFLTFFGNKSMRKVRSQSILESKLTSVHIAQTVTQFKWYALLWGRLNALNFR